MAEHTRGKQLVYSSGTPELDDAIPVLEKWYDNKIIEIEKNKENRDKKEEVKLFSSGDEKNEEISQLKIESDNHKQKGFITPMFEKLKNFNFGKKKGEREYG